MNLDLTSVRRALVMLAAAIAVVAQGGRAEQAPAAPAPPEAVPPKPSPEVLTFDRFIERTGPICLDRPAAACVDAGWELADRDRDGGLSVEELQQVRDELRSWSAWRSGDFSNVERSLMALGFLVVDGVGVERLHGLYDADGNGLVDRAELLADVRLDQRPLGEILLDPDAVDRAAIARRLGLPPALLEGLQP